MVVENFLLKWLVGGYGGVVGGWCLVVNGDDEGKVGEVKVKVGTSIRGGLGSSIGSSLGRGKGRGGEGRVGERPSAICELQERVEEWCPIPLKQSALGTFITILGHIKGDLEQYCDNYYSKEKFMLAYNVYIHPIPDIAMAEFKRQVDLLKPPLLNRMPDRPKKYKRREQGERPARHGNGRSSSTQNTLPKSSSITTESSSRAAVRFSSRVATVSSLRAVIWSSSRVVASRTSRGPISVQKRLVAITTSGLDDGAHGSARHAFLMMVQKGLHFLDLLPLLPLLPLWPLLPLPREDSGPHVHKGLDWNSKLTLSTAKSDWWR
ncbi:Uncharacterized protein TCM_043365 [Theobroma cacao]|uniref:Uncharacterized protein n=1 Tax=Theobroma cacao TaxID=3641 RepID=A0A061FQB0_THECC|nr:Uncharacterized protein TCM_043365 [Theobroma cacao]